MTDLKLAWNNDTGEADLVLIGPAVIVARDPFTTGDFPPPEHLVQALELAVEDGLDTAIIISLATDLRAGDDDVLPDPNGTRRGFWADSVAPVVEGDAIGSKIWLLERGKRTAQTLIAFKAWAEASLAWMIEDGIADTVVVTPEAWGDSGIAYSVQVTKAGKPSRYDYLWKGV